MAACSQRGTPNPTDVKRIYLCSALYLALPCWYKDVAPFVGEAALASAPRQGWRLLILRCRSPLAGGPSLRQVFLTARFLHMLPATVGPRRLPVVVVRRLGPQFYGCPFSRQRIRLTYSTKFDRISALAGHTGGAMARDPGASYVVVEVYGRWVRGIY